MPSVSAPGEDIILSPELRAMFPFSIEAKRQEGLGKIYKFVEQASSNAGNYTPVVICRSNRKESLVILKLTDFEKLIGQ